MGVGKTIFYITASFLLVLPILNKAFAESFSCSDILVIFARGSGQIQNDTKTQKETYKFFDEIKARAPAGVSVETKELEYPAAGGPLPGSFPIWLNAELPWDAPGTYYTSLGTGVANLNTLLNEQVRQCPNQKFVIGGYSQGAHVVGDTLYKLGDNVKNNIAYVGLFGDPKFKVDSFAARGSFIRRLGGILEPRNQDFPFELNDKLQSWCKSGDGICEDNLRVEVENQSLHNTYSAQEIPVAANHAAQRLKQYFVNYQIKSVHPGKMGNKVDVMYVADTTATMQGVLNNLLSNMTAFTTQTVELGTQTRLGLVQYNDTKDGCGIKPPSTLLDLTDNTSIFPAYFSMLSGSCGGAAGDDTYSGLLMAINNQPWSTDARKIIILLAGNTPNNPDKFNTSATEAAVINNARAKGISIFSVIRGDSAGQVGAHKQMIEATGGRIIFMKSGITSEFLKMYNNLSELLIQMPNLPIAKLTSSHATRPGLPIYLNAGGSYDPDGTLIRYEWDFDNDGTYDESTTSPSIAYQYPNAYEGLATVKVVSADGGTGIASTAVSINSNHSVKTRPPAPVKITASMGLDKTITLSWQADPTAPLFTEAYAIRNNQAERIAIVGIGTASIKITNIPLGEPQSFSIEAINEVGSSEVALSNVVNIISDDNDTETTQISQNNSLGNAVNTLPLDTTTSFIAPATINSFRAINSQQPNSGSHQVLGAKTSDTNATLTKRELSNKLILVATIVGLSVILLFRLRYRSR